MISNPTDGRFLILRTRRRGRFFFDRPPRDIFGARVRVRTSDRDNVGYKASSLGSPNERSSVRRPIEPSLINASVRKIFPRRINRADISHGNSEPR